MKLIRLAILFTAVCFLNTLTISSFGQVLSENVKEKAVRRFFFQYLRKLHAGNVLLPSSLSAIERNSYENFEREILIGDVFFVYSDWQIKSQHMATPTQSSFIVEYTIFAAISPAGAQFMEKNKQEIRFKLEKIEGHWFIRNREIVKRRGEDQKLLDGPFLSVGSAATAMKRLKLDPRVLMDRSRKL